MCEAGLVTCHRPSAQETDDHRCETPGAAECGVRSQGPGDIGEFDTHYVGRLPATTKVCGGLNRMID